MSAKKYFKNNSKKPAMVHSIKEKRDSVNRDKITKRLLVAASKLNW